MIAITACTFLLIPIFVTAAATAEPVVQRNEEASIALVSDPVSDVAAPLFSSSLFEPSATAPAVIRYNAPKVELFIGYSYLRAVPSIDAANRLVWLNGGSTSLAYNFNRYVGLVGDFGGFADSELNLTGKSSSHAVDSSGKVFTYLVGPRFSYRKYNRVTPFAQVLAGGAYASAVTLSTCAAVCQLLPSETGFAMTAGVGVDLRVRRHLAIRLVQAEYLMTRFEDRTTGETAMQNDIRLSSGLVFRFGGGPRIPEPELSYSCSVNPSSAYPGDAIEVSGSAINLNSQRTAVYTWSSDGGTVTGTSGNAKIDTTNIAPGTYTLKGHLSEGINPRENADCNTPYTIKAYESPTLSCSANPTSILIGGSSTITAAAVSPQGRPLTYSYSATAGSVTGTGPSAAFAAADSPASVVTVTCNVADDKGHSASATTPVTIEAPAAAPKPVISQLCSVDFDRDSRRPTRVNNEAKACLDQVALSLQSSSDAKLALVGDASQPEKDGKRLASERAVNTKAYLVGEKGIDASRIAIYTGSENGKKVATILIPDGATFDATGVLAVDEREIKARPRDQK
jgi:opacity protein-like surface antigen/outer membrane protein OmpA-like peptidoglycan-associated protein